MTVYLTRSQIAERYPISVHTLARLASDGRGPVFYKPTDKALYKVEDVEHWIESAAVRPEAPQTRRSGRGRIRAAARRGSDRHQASNSASASGRRLKSLPPSPNSFLLRAEARQGAPAGNGADAETGTGTGETGRQSGRDR